MLNLFLLQCQRVALKNSKVWITRSSPSFLTTRGRQQIFWVPVPYWEIRRSTAYKQMVATGGLVTKWEMETRVRILFGACPFLFWLFRRLWNTHLTRHQWLLNLVALKARFIFSNSVNYNISDQFAMERFKKQSKNSTTSVYLICCCWFLITVKCTIKGSLFNENIWIAFKGTRGG